MGEPILEMMGLLGLPGLWLLGSKWNIVVLGLLGQRVETVDCHNPSWGRLEVVRILLEEGLSGVLLEEAVKGRIR